jgi:hypothetical protein
MVSIRTLVVVVVSALALACGRTEQRTPEPLGSFQAAVVSVGGETTVGEGTPSTRNATCPDGSLPDQCGSWDGVELVASRVSGADERCLCRPIDFKVPANMPVTTNGKLATWAAYFLAGRQRATLSFRKASGAVVECRYKGERFGGPPRQGGDWHYVLDRCSDGSVAGANLRADWFSLAVGFRPGQVKLRLGEPDVVGGVVQESVFYSSDPRIAEAALYVPRGAAPANQEFTLTVLDQVPVGSRFENGGTPVQPWT